MVAIFIKKMKKYKIGKNEAGQRTDRFISRILTLASWGEIQKLFRKKVFKRNGSRSVKPGDFLLEGDEIEVFLSEESFRHLGADMSLSEQSPEKSREKNSEKTPRGSARGLSNQKTDVSTNIHRIYEDEDYLVVCKPAGMLVHSDSPDEKGDLTGIVRRMLADFRDAYFAPSTASRLDRGTSGIVIFAKNYQSLKKMNEEMRARRIERMYQCVVEGALSGSGKIELSLYKDGKKNIVHAKESGEDVSIPTEGTRPRGDGAKYAATYYHAKMLPGGKYSLVTAVLETGRTHQIRVSLSKIGHPIVGDVKYGSGIKRSSPLLHCAKVEMLGMCFRTESKEIQHFIERLNES